MSLPGIICENCGKPALRRNRAHSQKYCLDCSRERNLARGRKWAKAHPPSGDYISAQYRKTRSHIVGRGAEISKSVACDSFLRIPEIPPNTGWLISLRVPFSWASSKNHLYSNAKGGHHVFMRAESRKFQDDLILVVRSAIIGHRIYNNKVWISLFVQKPSHRGDAINVIDVVADALKKALQLDDRWFCIKRVDWEIAKNNPEIFITIEQPEPFDVQLCSHCGRLLPLTKFTLYRSSKIGVGRACHDCKGTASPQSLVGRRNPDIPPIATGVSTTPMSS